MEDGKGSGANDQVDPIRCDYPDHRYPQAQRKRVVRSGNGPPGNRPKSSQQTTNNKNEPEDCGEWVDGECAADITVEERGGRSGGATGRTGKAGQRSEDARTEVRRQGEPHGPKRERRQSRRQPQERELSIFARCGPQSPGAHAAQRLLTCLRRRKNCSISSTVRVTQRISRLEGGVSSQPAAMNTGNTTAA